MSIYFSLEKGERKTSLSAFISEDENKKRIDVFHEGKRGRGALPFLSSRVHLQGRNQEEGGGTPYSLIRHPKEGVSRERKGFWSTAAKGKKRVSASSGGIVDEKAPRMKEEDLLFTIGSVRKT